VPFVIGIDHLGAGNCLWFLSALEKKSKHRERGAAARQHQDCKSP
jgi:hypothetical protein